MSQPTGTQPLGAQLTGAALGSVVGCVEEVVASGLLLGVQIHATLHGEPLLDLTLGHREPGSDARPPRALTAQDPLPWVCVSKLFATILTGRLLATGELRADDRIADVVPEYGQGGKHAVTLEHLMSYTVPYAPYTGPSIPSLSHAEAVAAVCALPIDGEPGACARYNGVGSWQVLAELLARRTGTPYGELVASRILGPLGMVRTRHGSADGDRPRHELFEPGAGGFVPSAEFPAAVLPEHMAGTGAHGPARDLARLAECLTLGADGAALHPGVLSAEAGEHLFRLVRRGLPDEVFGGLDLDWGMGPCLDPLWFNAPVDAAVAGLTGFGTALVLADRRRGLVVSYLATSMLRGFPGVRPDRQLVDNLYRHLAA